MFPPMARKTTVVLVARKRSPRSPNPKEFPTVYVTTMYNIAERDGASRNSRRKARPPGSAWR